jgi:N utilization substance protein B
MINRTLIRLKIVQLIYSFYQNGGKDINTAEKELLFSLSKAYDLYNYLLLLMVDTTKYAAELIENQEELNKIAHKEEKISHKFVENRFIKQLSVNQQLLEYLDAQNRTWMNDTDYLKKLLQNIYSSETYKDYMNNETDDYITDKELWRKLYKSIIMKDERIQDVLEDKSLYWNDDKEIVDTFVIKTIKRFDEQNKQHQQLLPEYKDDEDREYAIKLFRSTILNDEDHRRLIAQSVKNWEFDRLAFMDVVIMQIAIAEILYFPLIPTAVTINEFVEIAKYYSTPKSASYVNGILDAVVKKLKKENIILKN